MDGVLLVNLGSPSAPTRRATRAFLAEFLGDPLVVDANPLLWWLVRNLIILPFRSGKSAELYAKIWTDEGSPLVAISQRLAQALTSELAPRPIRLAMRYGEPSIESGLRGLLDAGCTRVSVCTMFPQDSQTTTGTVEREARRVWRRLGRADGELSLVPSYHAHEGYVGSVAAGIADELSRGPWDHLILSFHGLPVRYVENGDPYRDHCEASAAAIAGGLGLGASQWTLAYQSKFGREAWLEPDTVVVAEELARRGASVVVACPAFTADCLETLEEIQLQLVESFREAGGTEIRVVPCLNDDPRWVQGLVRILGEETRGI